jgi:hypothetical protein
MASIVERLKRKPGPRLQAVLVLLLLAVLTILMTWPLAGRLGSHVPGRDGDVWVHLWTFRWIKDALLSGQNPYYTNLLFFPNGAFLYSHNIAWVNIALWLPLQALIGEGAAYSLHFLLIIIFNGFAGYLLVREFTGSSLAGFVGSLIIAFWPYALSHQDHPNLIFTAWIILALFFLKRFFDHQQKRDLLLAAVSIALIGLTRWQLLIIGGFIIGLYILYRLIGDKIYRTPRFIALLALIFLLALLVMIPLLLPIFIALTGQSVTSDLFLEVSPFSTDLLSYLTPSLYHPLWGETVSEIYSNFPVHSTVPFLGYTALVLAIIGIFTKWSRARFWLVAALLYILLALGPALIINGRDTGLPLPISLIDGTFIIQMVRRPIRFNIVLSIPVAVMAGYGVVSLRERTKGVWQAVVLATLIVALILSEYIVTYRTFPLETPAWYRELARQPGEFGIANIPMYQGQRNYKTYMYYQFVHKKPIVQGHISRVPPEATSFISSSLLLRKVRFEKMQVLAGEIVNVSEQLNQLAEADIRYLILHKQFLPEDELLAWQSWLGQEPYHEDSELAVYRTDPLLERDFSVFQELTTTPDGDLEIGLIRASVTPTSTIQGGTINVHANWYAGSNVKQDYHLCFNLSDDSQQSLQSFCESLAPTWSTSHWQAGEQFFTTHSFQASPYLDSGVYTVTLFLADNNHLATNDNIAALDSLALTALPRTFSQPDPSQTTNATWDDLIYLPGFDLSYPVADSLDVHVYWLAKNRMDASYTNFFHLVNPNTGEVVAQSDVIPRGWTYPTNWWEQDEWVEDRVTISLDGLPPGEYDLFTGWYNLDTGERLPAHSATGELFANDSVPLTTIER